MVGIYLVIKKEIDLSNDISDKPLAVTDEPNRVFSTGAQRDSVKGKARPILISPYFTERLAKHLGRGADKYCPRNWEKGFLLSDILDSLERHVIAIKMGKTDEDHEAAIACNIMFYLHTNHMIKAGLLPPTLNDMPEYDLLNTIEEYLQRIKEVSGDCVKK